MMVGTTSTWVPTTSRRLPNCSVTPGAISSSGTWKRNRSISVSCSGAPKPWSPTTTNRVSLYQGWRLACSKKRPSAQSE